MFRYSILILNLFFVITVFSQADTTKLVKYGPGFKFNEGIFLNFEQVKLNKAIPKSRIETKVNIKDLDFFDKLVRAKEIAYFDEYGLRQVVKTFDIWGYARKGSLYIQKGELFNRIPVIGSVCHFVANVTVYNDRHYDPYYNYSYNVQPNTTNELRQFVLDFETGKVLEYNYESILIILMRDEELYEEFNKLKKRKKREKKFLYVRKYNEKHPLYFPVN